MVKHSLNTFLAMEIVFANEIADVCQEVGADVDQVSLGFRSDRRVGDGPLTPGGPYRGGTLGRDVVVLNKHGAGPLLRAIKASNDARL
jgi:UDPglucose 6-dehydrogenase